MFTVFAPIRVEFCRAKLKYDTEHANETFDWIHIFRNVSTSTSTTKSIALYPKNETASLPKRGNIISNTRRKRHRQMRRNHLKKRKDTTKYGFHDTFPAYKKMSSVYDGRLMW